MSVSCCMHLALRIAESPLADWKSQIDAIPAQCQKPGECSPGIGCRENVAVYMRVQYRAQAARAGRK